MAQNVTIAGATFNSVPSIVLPTSSGGSATFYDCAGSKSITENGTGIDVKGYATVDVNVSSGGGGIAGVTELYSNDAVAITYTSTSAGTANSITGIANLCKYPMIIVIIENTDISAGSLKFIRSTTVIGNTKYSSSGATVTRYGTQHYYTSAGALTNLSATSYGLWGYTISTANALTIRGRCNASYYTSLTGTYKVRVLGAML